MEKGPVQNEGKDLVRSLVKLGYTPTRGELSTMSHSNDDYDYLYSYIKHGPSPLKDLCVRTLRKTFCSNVVYAVNKLPPIPEKEKLQVSRSYGYYYTIYYMFCDDKIYYINS